MDPNIKPWYEGMQGVNREVIGRQQAQTGLIELQRLKESQAAEAELMRAAQTDPRVQAMLFGGSTLGSLGTVGGGPPGGGAMTQQTTIPGQPPGAPQVVPGGQDLSQFATPGGPSQSTLASLGPQGGMPQAQGQPQNPLLEMAWRDPRAAMLLQRQIQGQQLNQLTMQEKYLDIGVKVSEAIARQFQGVTDQASMDEARERVRLIHPQAAAQIPQFYSKEAVHALQQRGIAMSEQAKNRFYDAQSRKLDVESEMLPKLYDRITQEDGGVPAGQAGRGDTALVPDGGGTGGAGNMGQRMNNPYNIKLGAGTQHWVDKGLAEPGEKAQDGGQFLKFKDPSVGEQAGLELLQGPGYRNLTVDAALKRWSNNGYGAEIVKDIAPTTLVKDLSAAQMRPLMAAMRQREGWNAGPSGGTSTAQATATDPRLASLEARIAKRTQDAQLASLAGNESLSTRLNDDANRLTAEKNRLIEESRRQQERADEPGQAAKKQAAELEAKQQFERQRQAGPMLPEERRKLLTGLRSDIRAEPTFKTYQEIRNGYQNVEIGAQRDSAEGDLALIYGIAKILDPGSVVRESEFATVEAAQGKLQQLLNTPKKFFEGDRLLPENRQQLLAMAYALAQRKLGTAQKELQAVYEPLAKEGNIQFSQLLPLEDLKPLGAKPGERTTKPVSEMTLEEARAERERIRKGG